MPLVTYSTRNSLFLPYLTVKDLAAWLVPTPACPPGGGGGDRTHDPRLAKPMLSQLSYTPFWRTSVVGLDRFELSTSRLSGVRSNQLSYRPLGRARNKSSLQLNSELSLLYKGGDPAAGSPTATLLRLHPNYQPYRRRLPPEG